MITQICIVLTAIMLLILSPASNSQPKVIGYLPGYQGIKKQVDKIDLSKISHLTLAFLHPNRQGLFQESGQPACMVGQHGNALTKEEIAYVVNKVHQAGKKMLISIGGAAYPACAGDWAMLLTSAKRQAITRQLLDFVEAFKFDGVDIDIEGKLLTQIDQQGNFVPFVRRLKKGLATNNKELSAATGSYQGGMVPEASLSYFDFVSIMSYDAIGPTWGPSGVEHSTLEKAKADIRLWRKKGLPKDKIILGLPFYGYGFGKYNAEYPFREVLAQFGDDKSQGDLIKKNCSNCSYITFNGYQTIKSKTQLALKEAGGVMIWELSHDQHDERGLLHVIDQTIKQKK